MRIAVWGINYAPEQTGIGPFNTGLCEWLAARGHEVRMVTSFPYYPEWRKRPGDSGRLYRTDRAAGVRIDRCWHYVPARPSTIRRMLHEASFVATSWLRLLVGPRPEVLVVVSPPLLFGLGAWLHQLLRGTPFVFHVQDLQPDAALGLGMVKPGLVTRLLYGLEALAYRKAARVSGICEGMLEAFRRKGVPRDRVVAFPNWLQGSATTVARGHWRARHGIPPEATLLVYSGNLGTKQGLEVVLEAARGGDPHVHWVIAGDGAARPALEERIRRDGSPVRLLPLQPSEAYHEMLADADACLITQQAGTGRFFFPSKLLSVARAGRPVIAVADADSELARVVASGGFGWVTPPADAAALRAAAAEVRAMGSGEAERRAAQARAWAEEFLPGRILPGFERVLDDVVRG